MYRTYAPSMTTSEAAGMWLGNLHDCYLTASLMRTSMEQAPLVGPDAFDFTLSDRGRFERCWHRDLYVLVEAWKARSAEMHEKYRAWAPPEFDVLVDLLSSPEVVAAMPHLRATRDYMSHRDRREYWDVGRYWPG